MSDFQVLFNGETLNGKHADDVEAALAAELGIAPAKARRLFNGRTVVLASQLSSDEAIDLQTRLETAGAVTRIKDLSPKLHQPHGYEHDKSDQTLRDLTAAHIECPRCGHMQLDASHCTQCGVDIEALARKHRKDQLLMEKQLRDHRAAQNRKLPDLAADAFAADDATSSETPEDPAKTGFFSRLFKRSA